MRWNIFKKKKLREQKIVPINKEELFSSNFSVEEERLAYVENKQLQQRLAYQLIAETIRLAHIKFILIPKTTKFYMQKNFRRAFFYRIISISVS